MHVHHLVLAFDSYHFVAGTQMSTMLRAYKHPHVYKENQTLVYIYAALHSQITMELNGIHCKNRLVVLPTE